MKKNRVTNIATHFIATCAFIFAALPALAEECPQVETEDATAASPPRTITGNLVYHDGIRQWFELRLNQPQCGQFSIQLVASQDTERDLASLRGCQVTSTGILDSSPTGYYSLELYQKVSLIEPVGICTRQSPFPDYTKVKPDNTLRRYRVDMHLEYAPGDHPIMFRITSAGKELHPWQAYVSYSLTGSLVLYSSCAQGFVIDKVFGTAEARPSHFDWPRTRDDMAMFDPEGAAAAGKRDLHLGFTCARDR